MFNVGILQRERGGVFQETVAQEEKARGPTVDSLVRCGIQKVRESETERRVREGV